MATAVILCIFVAFKFITTRGQYRSVRVDEEHGSTEMGEMNERTPIIRLEQSTISIVLYFI